MLRQLGNRPAGNSTLSLRRIHRPAHTSERPRIVFVGGGVPYAKALLEFAASFGEVLGVVTGRGRDVIGRTGGEKNPVYEEATRLQLPVFRSTSLKAGVIGSGSEDDNGAFEMIRSSRCHFILATAINQLLPPQVLDSASHGAIRIFPGAMPEYRGNTPIHWAIARGEHVTGVTAIKMNHLFDRGEILAQRFLPISSKDTAFSLRLRLLPLTWEVTEEALAGLLCGRISARSQSGHDGFFTSYLEPSSAGHLDPALSAAQVLRWLRGFAEWPGIRLALGSQVVKINRAVIIDHEPVEPQSVTPGFINHVSPDGFSFVAGDWRSVWVSNFSIKDFPGESRRGLFYRGLIKVGQVLTRIGPPTGPWHPLLSGERLEINPRLPLLGKHEKLDAYLSSLDFIKPGRMSAQNLSAWLKARLPILNEHPKIVRFIIGNFPSHAAYLYAEDVHDLVSAGRYKNIRVGVWAEILARKFVAERIQSRYPGSVLIPGCHIRSMRRKTFDFVLVVPNPDTRTWDLKVVGEIKTQGGGLEQHLRNIDRLRLDGITVGPDRVHILPDEITVGGVSMLRADFRLGADLEVCLINAQGRLEMGEKVLLTRAGENSGSFYMHYPLVPKRQSISRALHTH